MAGGEICGGGARDAVRLAAEMLGLLHFVLRLKDVGEAVERLHRRRMEGPDALERVTERRARRSLLHIFCLANLVSVGLH